MTDLIALLPLKGHSERIPGKNIRSLAGRPLFFWLADTLYESGLFSLMCINTDSEKIKDLARGRYAKDWLIIHDRPRALIGDNVPMNAVIRHDLSLLDRRALFLQVHSTTPFLGGATLASAVKEFREALLAGHDSMFCVTEHHSRFYDRELKPINHDPKVLARTQDLPPLLEDNSNFYLFSFDSFSRSESRVGLDPRVFAMPAGSYETHDIDDQEQWKHAELIAESLSQGSIG